MDEEKIASFCAVTDADPDLARQYIVVADGDLDRAIDLFLETGGTNLSGGGGSTATNPPIAPGEPVQMDDEDDESLAERLQREENSRQPQVRERIAPRTETLVEDYGFYPSLPEMSTRPAMRPSIFNQTPGGLGSNVHLTEKQSKLEALFRPPFEIMSNYDIDTAKIKGREQKKWLLVNVQDVSDFQCQVLNRDFWSHEAVKETVSANFIFMQYSKDAYDGQNFLQYYPVTKFPYIAILDPRTGEQMKSWDEVPTPEDWVVSVHEFLERFSLDPRSRNPIGKIAKYKPFDRMSEEEQLKFALEQSMGQPGEDSEEASDMSSVSVLESPEDSMDEISSSSRDKGKRKIEYIDLDEDVEVTDGPPRSAPEDLFATIEPVSRPEPDANPQTTTRVQIRLADGSRKVRRVSLQDPVRSLFEYIKSDIAELRSRHFQIIDAANHKKLIEFLDKTIEEVGLKNSVVLVEVDDEE